MIIVLLAACPERFDPEGTAADTGVSGPGDIGSADADASDADATSAADGSATSSSGMSESASWTTTYTSGATDDGPVSTTGPVDPSTSGPSTTGMESGGDAMPNDTGDPTVGGGCVDGQLQCAAGDAAYLLLCVNQAWWLVPSSYGYNLGGAGDCDGYCLLSTEGQSAASACDVDHCVCDMPCTDLEGSFFCWNADQFGYCKDGEFVSYTCSAWCQSEGWSTGACVPWYHATSPVGFFDYCVCG